MPGTKDPKRRDSKQVGYSPVTVGSPAQPLLCTFLSAPQRCLPSILLCGQHPMDPSFQFLWFLSFLIRELPSVAAFALFMVNLLPQI